MIAFKIAAINIIIFEDLINMKAKIIKGANFCHVAKIRHENHEIDVITEGNQKWSGAIPSFSIIEATRMIFMKFEIDIDHISILLINIILDPNAWAIKYLIVASVSWFDLEFLNIGMNLSILISMDIHRNNQFVLEIAIIVLRNIVIKAIMVNGLLR